MSEQSRFWREAVRIAAPLLIIAAGVAAFLVLWSMKGTPDVVPIVEKPPLVKTVPVAGHDQGLDITTDGLVAPSREVTIATQVAGKVVYKAPECEAGKFVTAGTPLFRIDPTDYQLEVNRLTKEREQADANLQEVDLELRNTQALIELAQEEVQLQQRELQRQMQLQGRQAVSQSALDQARRAELAARNALQTLENQRRLLETRRRSTEIARDLVEVQLEKARLDLERTEVKAPVAGVIVEEMVEEDSFVPVGSALAKIEDTSTVEVRSSLKMEELNWLWRQPRAAGSPYTPAAFSVEPPPEGKEVADRQPPSPRGQVAYQIPRAPVTVVYEVGGHRFAWEGVLDRYEGIGLDERTRTVPVRVVVPDPRAVKRLGADGGSGPAAGPPALMRGMYVRLRIHAQPDATLVRVPEEAIRPGGKVWVVRNGASSEGEERMFEEPVEVATVVDGWAVIDAAASNLRAGEPVVVTPLALERGYQWMLDHEGLPVEVEK